jgi:TatA/E family protein of Tat protein translocase
MFENLGIPEIVLIALAVLLLFGPDGLRSAMRETGKAVQQMKKVSREMMEELKFPNLRK